MTVEITARTAKTALINPGEKKAPVELAGDRTLTWQQPDQPD